MMEDKPDNSLPDFNRWKHLLFVADRVQDLPDEKLLEESTELIQSLLEHFPRELHPIEDLRAYAVRQFCKSIALALSRIEKSSPKPNGFLRWMRRESEK